MMSTHLEGNDHMKIMKNIFLKHWTHVLINNNSCWVSIFPSQPIHTIMVCFGQCVLFKCTFRNCKHCYIRWNWWIFHHTQWGLSPFNCSLLSMMIMVMVRAYKRKHRSIKPLSGLWIFLLYMFLFSLSSN